VQRAGGDDGVRAVVRGNQDYTVTLGADDGVLDYSCDCPVGSDGAFCKHCVAAALAWLNREAGPVKSARRGQPKEITLADAGKILQAEDKESLVGMMLDWAKDDDRLHERLILNAARRSGPDTGATAVRRAFEKAVRVPDFVHYREATGWARGVAHAIDSIEQLLNDGQAAGVIELCESALQSLLGPSRRWTIPTGTSARCGTACRTSTTGLPGSEARSGGVGQAALPLGIEQRLRRLLRFCISLRGDTRSQGHERLPGSGGGRMGEGARANRQA
jgi:hypothetical protein